MLYSTNKSFKIPNYYTSSKQVVIKATTTINFTDKNSQGLRSAEPITLTKKNCSGPHD